MAKGQGTNNSFTGQPESHTFDGFLFDVDGTIIDTTDAITKHWQKSVNRLLLNIYWDSRQLLLSSEDLPWSAESVPS